MSAMIALPVRAEKATYASFMVTPDHTRLRAIGGQIDIQVQPGMLDLSREELLNWVRSSAAAVTSYYGQFPMRTTVVRITPTGGQGIGFATADYEGTAGHISVPLGRRTTQAQLRNDWVLTHEFVHLGFPLVDKQHRWLAEGIATYVEPIARMRTGALTEEKVWGDLMRDLPQGLPESGDRGLNNTHTWGRTYWGGALYCLLADIEIRRRTDNKKGLIDALRAIAQAGGNIASDWETEDALVVGDRAIGANVLQRLYHRMKDNPVSIDLPQLWKLLGVYRSGNRVLFDNSAPWAEIRKGIAS